ncbi:hypothetical protein Tco_1370038 [Tanacetum coccineum]
MMVQDQEEVGKGSERLSDSHHTPTIIQPSTSQPQKKQRSRRPKRKDTQTRSENVSKLSNDPLLARGNTLQSGKDRLKLKELMALCRTLQQRVLDLRTQRLLKLRQSTKLKLRVKKLEKKGGSKTHKLKRLYKVGRSARVISYDEASLGEINVAEKEVITVDPVTTASEVVTTASVDISTASPTKTTIADDLTIAQTLIEIRSKAIMEEPEKPTKRKDQIKHDKDVTQRLQAQMQAELEEEDKLAKIEAGHLLVERLQVREQEKLTIKERAKLFQQLLEKRRILYSKKIIRKEEQTTNKSSTKEYHVYLAERTWEGCSPKSLKNKVLF